MPPGFFLRKHYMDVVCDDGQVFVGYAAVVRWKSLALGYHGYLRLDAQAGLRGRNRFRSGRPPCFEPPLLQWQAPGIEGRWHSLAPSLEESLLRREDGEVVWKCLQPRAEAVVRLEGEAPLAGLGYSEALEMTIEPWNLPIRELRWGRFHGPDQTLVWIEWRGAQPLQLVFHNGRRCAWAEIEDQGLRAEGVDLRLSDPAPLRGGELESTVFSRSRWLRRLLPASILRLDERKWCSRGVLQEGEGVAVAGRAIHEVVRWP
jgi:hypothetical protein